MTGPRNSLRAISAGVVAIVEGRLFSVRSVDGSWRSSAQATPWAAWNEAMGHYGKEAFRARGGMRDYDALDEVTTGEWTLQGVHIVAPDGATIVNLTLESEEVKR